MHIRRLVRLVPRLERSGVDWTAYVVSLGMVAPLVTQVVQRRLGFNPFRYYFQFKRATQGDDCLGDRLAGHVMLKPLHERLVNLDFINW